jgi:hypothetical protein
MKDAHRFGAYTIGARPFAAHAWRLNMSNLVPATVLEDTTRPRRLTDAFRCHQRGRSLLLATCLDDYMNANALRVKSMVCFECHQGVQNRESFAADADTEGLLDSEIWARLMAELKDVESV